MCPGFGLGTCGRGLTHPCSLPKLPLSGLWESGQLKFWINEFAIPRQKGWLKVFFHFCVFLCALLVWRSLPCSIFVLHKNRKTPQQLGPPIFTFLGWEIQIVKQLGQSMGGSHHWIFSNTPFVPAPGSHHTDPHGDFLSLLSGKKDKCMEIQNLSNTYTYNLVSQKKIRWSKKHQKKKGVWNVLQ